MKNKKTFEVTLLIFQLFLKSLATPTSNDRILACKSKWLSEKSIKPPITSDNSLASKRIDIFAKIVVKVEGSCLKQNITSFNHQNVAKFFMVYKLKFGLGN